MEVCELNITYNYNWVVFRWRKRPCDIQDCFKHVANCFLKQ